MGNQDFIKWVRVVINPQAVSNGNSTALGDYSRDGNKEFCYPYKFMVESESYCWEVSRAHTKGRSLVTHYEIWFHGKAFKPCRRIATGIPDARKIRKGLRVIYDYYKGLQEEREI